MPRRTHESSHSIRRFLFTSLSQVPGGGSATVLSALARMDLDPWEEAARLTTLSRSDAAKSLASTLNQSPEDVQQSLETEKIASRLVTLLPTMASAPIAATARAAPVTAAESAKGKRNFGPNFWLVWLCIQIFLLTIVSFQGKATIGNRTNAASDSANESSNEESLAPERSDAKVTRTEPGKASPPMTLPTDPTAR